MIDKEIVKRLKQLRKNEFDGAEKDYLLLLESIVYNNAEEIVAAAYNEQTDSHDGIVFLNLNTGELESKRWTSNTRIHPDAYEYLIELYKLKSDWENNFDVSNYDYLITDEEYDLLREKFETVDVSLREQVESIGIDFDDRVKELFVHNIKNRGVKV